MELAKQRRYRQKRDNIPIVQFMTIVSRAIAGVVTSKLKHENKDFFPEICKHIVAFLIDEVGLFKTMFPNNEQVQLFLQNKAGAMERIQQAVAAIENWMSTLDFLSLHYVHYLKLWEAIWLL